MSTECDLIRPQIEPFVDGELRGNSMLRVLRHLDDCTPCSDIAASQRELGDLLRRTVPADPPAHVMDGLISTAISRSKAEEAQSWWAFALRAKDEWHWPVVLAGSVAATFFSTLLLSAILAFGPKPEREDSLSALINNLGSPAGLLFVYATPVGVDQDWVLMQVDDGRPASRVTAALVSRTTEPSEAELVGELVTALNRHGRFVGLEAMDPDDRRHTEALLQAVRRARLSSPVPSAGAMNVHEVRLVTSTSVSAKGL